MSADHTQQQSPGQLKASADLSRKPKPPPAQIPGYAIDSLLGSGAYGEVWWATDQKTGRRVAIKFYTRQSTVDFSLLAREVEKLVFLSADRYVVQLLDVGWDAQPPYYVMDYISNGSLEDELSRRTTMPVDEAVELAEEICIGLMHLHGKGVLHCDLKPGNVLLDEDKKPRLADFGQSRLSHEQAPALGTLFFMAPEQADLKAVPDAKWDVYALGALLYCMLTGNPPFRDDAALSQIESSGEIEDRLLEYRKFIDGAPKPTAHRGVPGVDRNLAEIIDRCITPDPKQRFASVESVLQALRQRDLAHARRPLMILGILGPLLLLVVASLFAWNAYRSAISQSDQSITEKALESNQWAAQLAARSAAEQIDDYFRVVTQFVDDTEFKKMFAAAVKDEKLREMVSQLSDPHKNDSKELEALRDEFIELKARQPLQDPLKKNLHDPQFPTAASWFLCDHTGTQIASEFDRKDRVNTIGKNYSYRSYFTGRSQIAESTVDGIGVYDVSSDIDGREHIDKPNMSAIFISKATGTWKIAFSTPIKYEGEFLGIAAVTADLGSLIEFPNSATQYVMLVDDRPGNDRGTVLEHPLHGQLKAKGREIPESILRRSVSKSVQDQFDLGQTNIIPFPDPMSEDPLGPEFAKQWIASWADVKRKSSNTTDDSKRQITGLKVIAVEDHQEALDPSRNLGVQLARTGTLALLFFMLVSGGLLLIVFRSIRRSRERMTRLIGIGADANSLQNMSTVLASSHTPVNDPTQKDG